jgi:hypothetical protein
MKGLGSLAGYDNTTTPEYNGAILGMVELVNRFPLSF